MSTRKLDNAAWEGYINKFNSYSGTITVKDFCVENKITKSQFYYHKKRLEKTDAPVFQYISLNTKQTDIEQNVTTLKEVKINIGNASIAIPVSETTLIASIIKELATKC
jgi:hypothetical protein